jgi:hypothetical protein
MLEQFEAIIKVFTNETGNDMNENPLKPRKEELHKNLQQYVINHKPNIGTKEYDFLKSACEVVDRAIRVLARLALENAPFELKKSLITHLSAGEEAIPVATILGNDIYRISLPISFIHKLLSAAATLDGKEPTDESAIYWPSIIIASLAAFAHELNHVFVGHLTTESSIAQECNSDYIGGGLTWEWLHIPEIQAACMTSPALLDKNCIYGFLHLISILNDAEHDKSIYLPRVARFGIYCGGAGFYADNKEGKSGGDRLELAVNSMPTCPDQRFDSSHIRQELQAISSSPLRK